LRVEVKGATSSSGGWVGNLSDSVMGSEQNRFPQQQQQQEQQVRLSFSFFQFPVDLDLMPLYHLSHKCPLLFFLFQSSFSFIPSSDE
jgi:hypothetical protein